MIIRQFIAWLETAPATARAEAATALARAYLESDLGDADKRDAEAAITVLLDDASPLVRRNLAEAFAHHAQAPHFVIVALANDQSDIAAPVLARSPLLTDADLVDCAAIGDDIAQSAVAMRADLPSPVAAALAEIGAAQALVTLLRNRSSDIPDFAYQRMLERHGDDADLREAMLARRDLPVSVREALVAAVSQALGAFVQTCNWLRPERGARCLTEAREAATIGLAQEEDEASALISHLREQGRLTAGLILRAILSCRTDFAAAAFANLTGQPTRRVKALLAERRLPGFKALYRKAGLPEGLYEGFAAAITAWQNHADGLDAHNEPALSRRMIEHVLTALGDVVSAERDRLFALLRRFEAEAAREEARAIVKDMIEEAALLPWIAYQQDEPVEQIASALPVMDEAAPLPEALSSEEEKPLAA
jgi:uncharacterized protein (DUF2336 family)